MITQLRQRLQALQRPAKIENGAGVLSFGIAAIDAVLGGGLDERGPARNCGSGRDPCRRGHRICAGHLFFVMPGLVPGISLRDAVPH